MASMDIDKPLDELIKPRTRGGAGRRRGVSGRGGSGDAAPAAGGARARYSGNAPRSSGQRGGGNPAPAAPAGGKTLTADASKIIISNLPADVTEAAVRDLMQSTVGPVRVVQMSYNASGKSTGSATVLFRNKGDANKAHATYHNRMIDNQRPMRVEIAVDPNALQTLASRVAPAGGASRGGRQSGDRTGGDRRGGDRTGGDRTGGDRNSGGRAPRPRAARPAKKTAEDLDAEMAAYKTSATA